MIQWLRRILGIERDKAMLDMRIRNLHERIDNCITEQRFIEYGTTRAGKMLQLKYEIDELNVKLSKCLNLSQLEEAVAGLRMLYASEPQPAPQHPTMRERILDFYERHEGFYFYKDVAAAQGISSKLNSIRAEFSDMVKAGLLERGTGGTYRRAA